MAGRRTVLCVLGVMLLLASGRRAASQQLPGAPVGLAASVMGSDVTLAWNPPASGGPVLEYLVEAGTASGASDLASVPTGSAATRLTATSVPAGVYHVRVRARNAFGLGVGSNEVVVTVAGGPPGGPGLVPGVPVGLSGSVAGSRVLLSWNTPVAGGAPDTYVLEAGSAPGSSDLARFATGSLATAFTSPDVPPLTYYLRVRARNAAGESGASNEVSVTVSTAPPAPPGGFTIDLPILAADTARTAYGVWPYGVHGGNHADDGHPGWDLEFRLGASVRAPADGRVQSVMPDSFTPGRFTLQVEHPWAPGQHFRTVYTNLSDVAPGVAPGAAVTAGQILGTPGVIASFSASYAMIHFQLDDFNHTAGLTNVHAVSPYTRLSAAGRAAFDANWASAVYYGELTEPLHSNPRDVSFPLTRTWTRQDGSLHARIDFTRAVAIANDYTYTLFDTGSQVVETGSVLIQPNASPVSSLDLRPATGGPARLGVYDIVGETMRIDYSSPGEARPISLANASTYRTR